MPYLREYYLCIIFPLANVKLIKAYGNRRTSANLANIGSSRKLGDTTKLAGYLAGLIEGDGALITPTKDKNPSGSATVASIQVVFASKDRPSALLLKSFLGGNVYDSKGKNCVRWMIQDKKSVTRIVELINGKFRTPKINALHKMVDFLNNRGANIVKLPLDTSPLNSNAWLAGFVDADGSFAIKGFSDQNSKTHLAIQFYLPQRAYDISGESLKPIMSKIADFLFVKLNERIMAEKFASFVINTSNRVSNKVLIDYLNTYPLLSSKFLDFKDWETANNIYINKLHKDPVEYEKLRELKENMNNRRVFFNWDHHRAEIYGL